MPHRRAAGHLRFPRQVPGLRRRPVVTVRVDWQALEARRGPVGPPRDRIARAHRPHFGRRRRGPATAADELPHCHRRHARQVIDDRGLNVPTGITHVACQAADGDHICLCGQLSGPLQKFAGGLQGRANRTRSLTRRIAHRPDASEIKLTLPFRNVLAVISPFGESAAARRAAGDDLGSATTSGCGV
jgi:hypothetical protein